MKGRPASEWKPTPAHARAVVASFALAAVAVLARRPDLLVLAAPFLAAAAMGAAARPTASPVVRQRMGHGVLMEGETTTWHVDIDDTDGGAETVAAVLDVPAWVDRGHVMGRAVTDLDDERSAHLGLLVRPTRWGRLRLGPALVVANSPWGAFRSVLRRTDGDQPLMVLPKPAVFDAPSAAVSKPGLVGVHRSPRHGSGNEFAGIRSFQPGDRLRRIHWKQSLRTGELHVTSTHADHDRHVVLLVDALNDIGESDGIDGRASSLDTAFRAAGAIAAHHLGTGDRVSMMVMSANQLRRLAPGNGMRHLDRMMRLMASTDVSARGVDDGRVPPGLGSGALVVVLSPLVAAAALQRAFEMARHGHSVVVIDTLPPDITRNRFTDPRDQLAWRIRLLERQRELRRIQDVGVPVVPWRGPGSLDMVLRELARRPGAAIGRRP
ncbi:MAG: hypothetical protein RL238_2350 [Actinomycetota bacterium]